MVVDQQFLQQLQGFDIEVIGGLIHDQHVGWSREQLGKQHAIAYSPDTGKELWRMRGLTGQSTPSPVAADGLLYLATGSQGESNRPVYAVRPGAAGDISLAKGEEKNQFVAWLHPRASAYTSSPLVYRGRMYVVNDNGILTVFDSQTGKEVYKARAGGSASRASAL